MVSYKTTALKRCTNSHRTSLEQETGLDILATDLRDLLSEVRNQLMIWETEYSLDLSFLF